MDTRTVLGFLVPICALLGFLGFAIYHFGWLSGRCRGERDGKGTFATLDMLEIGKEYEVEWINVQLWNEVNPPRKWAHVFIPPRNSSSLYGFRLFDGRDFPEGARLIVLEKDPYGNITVVDVNKREEGILRALAMGIMM